MPEQTRTLRVALGQINTTVGDMSGNVRRVLDYAARARDLAADVVCFPELTVTGYPPEDLLLRPAFVRDNLDALQEIVAGSRGITVIVGFVDLNGGDIYNAAAVIHDGRLAHVYHKQYLPNYGVFDEFRYFRPGHESPVYTVAGAGVGVNICEDIWYPGDPTRRQAFSGAHVVLNINGSPYHVGKREFREQMLAQRARDYGVYVCYTNQVGGQDELVFDGGSMVLDARGELVSRAAMFEEELLICDIDIEEVLRTHLRDPRHRQERAAYAPAHPAERILLSAEPFAARRPPLEPRLAAGPDAVAEVYGALVLGTRDYIRKIGAATAFVALSGGVDSSLVAVIAADAIGAENVTCVSMPSRYSSEGSIRDAKELAENLGVEFMIIPIEPAHAAYLDILSQPFTGTETGVAEENIQPRVRATIILALSNKQRGSIVLTTGNKSEFATGYCTLAGDLVGGFGVIRDVPKTLVYKLARHRNALGDRPVIPESVLTKPPSAELRPGQLDTDTLPPYETLDAILEEYVENDRSVQDIVAMGFDEATVKRVALMVHRNEYKRRQAPPGVKITPRAFGRDWRLPIANQYRGF